MMIRFFMVLTVLFSGFSETSSLSAEAVVYRQWTNQAGKSIKAKMIELQGSGVVLELENGTRSQVPLGNLSEADQKYAKEQQTAPSAVETAPQTAALLRVWPAEIQVNPKAIMITLGVQDATARKFEYFSGSFRFISNAALTGTLMRDIAADFELTRALITQLPWGWQPRPLKGEHFLIYLTETTEDFIALGGNDVSAAGSKDDYAFVKFTTLGLKKVAERYTYDSRLKNEGEVVGMTVRLLMGEMRSSTSLWASIGFEELMRTVAYHKGAFQLLNLEKELKNRISEQEKYGVFPDVKRMLHLLRQSKADARVDVKLIRQQNFFDGMLLCYFFGYLDGDGLGGPLHSYYQGIAKQALMARSPGVTGSERRWTAEEHLERLLRGRSDASLATEILAKFKGIHVKFDK
jgi:hypothetical protein